MPAHHLSEQPGRSSSACRTARKTKPSASAPVQVLQRRPTARRRPSRLLLHPPSELVAPFPIRPRSRPLHQEGRTPPRSRSARSAAEPAGTRGGKARAANLTPEELSAIGRKGAAAKAEELRRQKLAEARGGSRIPDEDFSPDDGLIVPGRQRPPQRARRHPENSGESSLGTLDFALVGARCRCLGYRWAPRLWTLER
jgi:hypothetical protein